MQTPRADLPIQELLFFVADDFDNVTAREMEQTIGELAHQHSWSLSAPIFVNEVDDSSISAPEDLPIQTLGGILRVYSAWPPEGEALPKDLDRANFDDVKTLVEALAAFSSKTGHEIAFELKGEHVGTIRLGKPDRLLQDGFLGEWERSLKRAP
jgi:hypothetical protein